MTAPLTAGSEDATRILRAAVAAADPQPAVRRAIASLDIGSAANIYIVAVGKAAAGMARAAVDALPRPPRSGLVVVPHGAAVTVLRDTSIPLDLDVLHASHPLPDAASASAGNAIENLLRNAGVGDLVLVLLSGGASSLCVAPVPGLEVTAYAHVVRAVMHAGADIRELNTVRAHIDRLKGGGMARLLAPARAVGLIVSDVVGNPLDVIASGPLTPPRTTPSDALAVLTRCGLVSTLPAELVHDLQTRTAPPDHDAAFEHIATRVLLDNSDARAGAAAEARRLGYAVQVSSDLVTGSARDAGREIARFALHTAATMLPGDQPVCLVSGGEPTVTVTGTGAGGRNQELVLAAALELNGHARITIASIGTDGIDGPTDAAGAVADGPLVMGPGRLEMAVKSLLNNDSHSFFDAAGGLLRTGPTGTNVMDVQLALIASPR